MQAQFPPVYIILLIMIYKTKLILDQHSYPFMNTCLKGGGRQRPRFVSLTSPGTKVPPRDTYILALVPPCPLPFYSTNTPLSPTHTPPGLLTSHTLVQIGEGTGVGRELYFICLISEGRNSLFKVLTAFLTTIKTVYRKINK